MLLAVPYVLTGLMAGTGRLPAGVAWACLTLPLAVRWALRVWRNPVGENDVRSMAMLHLAFGALFAAGLI